MNKKSPAKPSQSTKSVAVTTKRSSASAPRARKSSDYNMHAAIIAVSVLIGLGLAACTAGPRGRDRQMLPPSPPPMVETPTQESTDSSGSGYVQGATTGDIDQELEAIDDAMFSPLREANLDGSTEVVAP